LDSGIPELGEDARNIIGAGCSLQLTVIVKQYSDFKCAVSEKIKCKLVTNFAHKMTLAFQNQQFCDLAKLMDIEGTFLASSIDSDWGFSLMN
jgi:hypothetical protein